MGVGVDVDVAVAKLQVTFERLGPVRHEYAVLRGGAQAYALVQADGGKWACRDSTSVVPADNQERCVESYEELSMVVGACGPAVRQRVRAWWRIFSSNVGFRQCSAHWGPLVGRV